MQSRSFEPSLSRHEQKRRSYDRAINLFLQGIIVANPHHDPTTTVEARLAHAREALLGEKPARGRKAIREDVKLFPLIEKAFKVEADKMKRAVIGRQRLETQAEWTRQLADPQKSVRGIAKEHLPAFAKPTTSPASTEDWLRRVLADLKLTVQDMADLEGFFYGDSPKAERLQRIFRDLKGLGIDSSSTLGIEMNDISPKQD